MSDPDLAAFIAPLKDEAFIHRIAQLAGIPKPAARFEFLTYLNETSVGLELAKPGLRHGKRILEVGSGLCALSLFLRSQGYQVTALEPLRRGFALIDVARQIVLEKFAHIDLPVLNIPVEELRNDRHGQFDFIFSVHVLEHIDDLPSAFQAMTGVLALSGFMRHVCPNYRFPYDPHLSIPLVPFLPRATELFLRPETAKGPYWSSINFITAAQVRRLAHANGLEAVFERGVARTLLRRLIDDPLFAARHNTLMGRVAKLLAQSPVGDLAYHLPPSWVSPMIFDLLPRVRPDPFRQC
jgi:2-polyprenyl-3-methyl-5-hydroxy-6-metoxy-1,4-benzoquinol methylase